MVAKAWENERFYSNLKEKDLVANSFFNYDFSAENKTRIFELGGDVRYTKRDFQSIIFNHDFSTRTAIDVNNPDLIFNQTSLDNGIFESGVDLVAYQITTTIYSPDSSPRRPSATNL